RTQVGKDHPPRVKGLLPALILAADDTDPGNREEALLALADTGDPNAVPILRRQLADRSPHLRLTAACLLTEFHDSSGLTERKHATQRLLRFEVSGEDLRIDRMQYFSDCEMLLASLERLTEKSLGEIPLNPFFSADSAALELGPDRYQALLQKWITWWQW